MTSCVLVHNPVSRASMRREQINDVIAIARIAGWRVTPRTTDAAGHATALAREAAEHEVDVLLVNGGDGTVNEVVNGLAGTRTALAVLPGGTANVWAKEIGLSRKPMHALRAALDGERRSVDLGRAGERYFLLMAGVGLDAEIVPRVGSRLKRRAGALAYITAGAGPALRGKSHATRMTIDGAAKETGLHWMIVGNTRSYGGLVRITHRATVTDGRLDMALMHRGGIRRLIVDGVRVLRGRHERSLNVTYVQAASIDVETAGIPVQVDGEAHGVTPMRFEAVPGALEVIVPVGLRSPLFG
ncbi:MAG: diacylglycerol kinase family protein [Dehalococcoidia bacterium]